jgi:HTH-type transcriptional regulator/antitoxin HigA
MDITPIRTDVDYRRTLAEIEALMDAEAGTLEGDRLDVLSTLVEAYEREHFPLDLPDPVEAINSKAAPTGEGPEVEVTCPHVATLRSSASPGASTT